MAQTLPRALEASPDVVISDWMSAAMSNGATFPKPSLFDIIPPEATGTYLEASRGKIGGVVHMGAISSPTETDSDAIVRNNIRLSIDLWTYCARFVRACDQVGAPSPRVGLASNSSTSMAQMNTTADS